MQVFKSLFPYVGVIWGLALVAALIIQKIVPNHLHGLVRTVIFFGVAAIVAAIVYGIVGQFLPTQMAALDTLLSGNAVYYVSIGFAGSVLSMGLVFELSDSGYAHVVGMLVSFVFFLFFGFVLNDQNKIGYNQGYQEGIYAASNVPKGRTTLPILIETDSGVVSTVIYPKVGEYQQFYDLVTGVERAGGEVTLRRGKSGGSTFVIILILMIAAVSIFFLLANVRKPKKKKKKLTTAEQVAELMGKKLKLEAMVPKDEEHKKQITNQLMQVNAQITQLSKMLPQQQPMQVATPGMVNSPSMGNAGVVNPTIQNQGTVGGGANQQPLNMQFLQNLPQSIGQLTAQLDTDPDGAKQKAAQLLQQLRGEIPKIQNLPQDQKQGIMALLQKNNQALMALSQGQKPSVPGQQKEKKNKRFLFF